ncbi:glycosyltransferase family 2 protein [Chroococcidiopsis sp. FACHB-1243]|uniref:glycosyltransferase family 2 protein n=1 Tax=Chroococcidiopsis sp. [FACHB-1243] TaxID=2692781 RepID=UPI001785D0E1|nr:glycosyltransferase family A protein [Chroococcidiopsis sp. [FACHB-1243]]MBD2308798.1 glycosyltransferase family 2 protein [Chroococcidiopsis sp. [FACHB-1243]]
MQPLVTIGLPVLNSEKTLKAAICSILNQTYCNWELIIIDDGSKDRTLSVAQSFQDPRITVIADGLHMNLSHRLNQAISLAKGKYFARMDGDDISYPERLEAQVRYMEKHPNIDLLATRTIVFDKDGHSRGCTFATESHAEICSRPWSGFPLAHPTWLGKLEWFLTHQYRENAIRMEDYDLLLRTYKTSCFSCLPQILLGYRVESLSLKKILASRYHHCITLMNKAFFEKDYLLAVGVVEQAIKALVDIFAIATGLNFKLLRHRAGSPVNQVDLIKWEATWDTCNSDNINQQHPGQLLNSPKCFLSTNSDGIK